MIRFVVGCILGALGATYLIGWFLSATAEATFPSKSELPTRTLGGTTIDWSKVYDDTWTGPIT